MPGIGTSSTTQLTNRSVARTFSEIGRVSSFHKRGYWFEFFLYVFLRLRKPGIFFSN